MKIDLSNFYLKLKMKEYERESLLRSLSYSEQAILSVSEELSILNESLAVINNMIDYFSNDLLEKLEELVNQALRVIFYDRDYRIKFDVMDLKSRRIDIYLLEGDIEATVPTGIGGGVLTVISFVIHIYLMKVYKLDRVVFLDEQFTQISSDYIERFYYFLREVSNQMGFKFILITQDDRVPEDFFDNVYYVSAGKVKEVKS